MIFGSKHSVTAKLGPKRITVETSEDSRLFYRNRPLSGSFVKSGFR